ncbi:MAG: Mlc titration factor MtfA (ptsG expression regulator) [Psychromonas sp.]|jgi:Mlc titration factor MtfA (ptsG expression regulator)
MKNSRFVFWIALIVVMLLSIVLLAHYKHFALMKITGVITIVSVALALSWWRKQTKKRKIKKDRIPINLNDRFWLNEHILFYKKLSKSDKKVFEDRMALFLAEIRISDVDLEQPSKEHCFYVAASAVITYWGLPFWDFGRLEEVLLYPDNFNQEKQCVKGAAIQGMVTSEGNHLVMILSKPALEFGFKNKTDKLNVGIHEFAHILDAKDGEIDGEVQFETPIKKAWLEIVNAELVQLEKGNSDINPYAKKNASEFFAVVWEYYKERPELFRRKHADLYAILEAYQSQTKS